MKIAVFYGTKHQGSTYHIAKQIMEGCCIPEEDIKEFYLPDAMPNFCRGCFNCIANDVSKCPDYEYTKPIMDAIIEADLLLFATPTYVYHMTAQMKAMFDHLAFWWMVHRPEESMFHKQAVVISTAAGGGTKSAIRDVKDSLRFWGVGKVFTYGINVRAANWQGVSAPIKRRISRDTFRLSHQIMRHYNQGNLSPSFSSKCMFYKMRFFQKKIGISDVDVAYWRKNGWLEQKRPWKQG